MTVVVHDHVGSVGNLSGSTTLTITIVNVIDSPTVTCPLDQASPFYKFYVSENLRMNDAVLHANNGTAPLLPLQFAVCDLSLFTSTPSVDTETGFRSTSFLKGLVI